MTPGQAMLNIKECMEEQNVSFQEAYRICLGKDLIIEDNETNVVIVARG